MLHRHINQFLDYCRLADFSIRSIQALTARLNEFDILPENTTNSFYQKGSLPASDRFCSRLQRPFHSCHKIQSLGPQAILPFFDPSQDRT